jgi:carbamoyltransferase
MRELIRHTTDGFELQEKYFSHFRSGLHVKTENGTPVVQEFGTQEIERLLGPRRRHGSPVTSEHEDLAASLQSVTEETIAHLLSILSEKTGTSNLVVVGGVAMNSVAIGKIPRISSFQNVFVPPGAADNGGAIGAALYVASGKRGSRVSAPGLSPYLGPVVDYQECSIAVRDIRKDFNVNELREEDLVQTVAKLISDNQIVGWFQGRMEFGARALGARSLLADPRNPEMRDIINSKIKFREKFRPFAPSVLEEYAADYFEDIEKTPYMERVLTVKKSAQSQIPAVTHIDGTGRLQTVSRSLNPLYWRLIEEFRKITGVPILLNTSLNENEPIVNTPGEALSCFSRTRMDAIALGPFLVTRKTPIKG